MTSEGSRRSQCEQKLLAATQSRRQTAGDREMEVGRWGQRRSTMIQTERVSGTSETEEYGMPTGLGEHQQGL